MSFSFFHVRYMHKLSQDAGGELTTKTVCSFNHFIISP